MREFKCTVCRYLKRGIPQYPFQSLHPLCKDCVKRIEQDKPDDIVWNKPEVFGESNV